MTILFPITERLCQMLDIRLTFDEFVRFSCSLLRRFFFAPLSEPILPFWVSHKTADVIREDDDYSYITESN